MDSGMYTEREVQCLKEGMGAVRSVLSGTDTEAKRRLLFYLDSLLQAGYFRHKKRFEGNAGKGRGVFQ